MKIGIIGSGIVGQTLAKAFTSEGHTVMLGTRNIAKKEVVDFNMANPQISIGDFVITAAFGEVLVLATGGSVTLEAITLAGTENFTGKLVIDTTNPIAAAPPVDGVLQYFTGPNESLMERIQQHIPDAWVVKAFNSVGNAAFYKPTFTEGTPTMFIAGNNDTAKATVTTLLAAFGWDTADMGKAAAARAIEPLCMLWCIDGFVKNDWYHAFKILRK